MFSKKCASKIWEMRKKRRRGNKRPATDLGERASTQARSKLAELPNTMFTVMTHWVSNSKDMVLAPKQLQGSYTDVRYWSTCLIPSTKIAARQTHTFTDQCSCAPWSRTNWKRSIWEYTNPGKWSMTPYMARFLTTGTFQMLSSWNLDIMWRYLW